MSWVLTLWLASSSAVLGLGAAEHRGMQSPADEARQKDCLHRSTTEEMCRRRCPGEPVGDCLYRVRAEQAKNGGRK